jgi:tetratricopeptide (TPR) repeat protein
VRGRLEAAAASRGLTPFVGREDELRLLMSRWERALGGEGQVALIIGEAGIGKSRLLQRFHEQIGGTPHTWIEAHAGAFFQNTPFYPVTELLQHFLGGNGGKPAEEQLAQLEPWLELAGLKPADTIPLIAPLLNLPLSDKYPPSSLSPEQQRRRLLATLVEWVSGAARVQPMVIATEDLHWADASTLELIQLLVEQGATARLLLLYTARPEFRAQWPPRAHHTHITLNRLNAPNAFRMVQEVAARNLLSKEILTAVAERTGGVPLFVEELMRAVLESGDTKLAGSEIPVTLHDSLMARLDRLGPAKEIIQIGAVIGGEFSYELLHAVHPITEENLQRALRNLVDAELIYVRGIAPEATYRFKHALIRDAAYEALLKRRRRQLHREIALTLKDRFVETAASTPELLAHHYTEAGLIDEAVRYWRKAGQSANERSAYTEATAHLNRGLELVERLPETAKRMSEELRLQIALTAPLTATKGYTAPEVEKACSRALELSQQIGESPQLFPVLARLYSVYANRGELQKSLDLAEQMLRLASTRQEPLSLLWAHYCLGHTLTNQGKFEMARVHTEECLARYDFDQPREYGWIMDPGATGLARLAHILHLLGYLDQALEKSLKALDHARRLSQPFTLAWVLGSVGAIHAFRREFEIAERLWSEDVRLCAEHNFSSLLASAIIGRDWAIVEQGRGEKDTSRMRQLWTRPVLAGELGLERGNYLIRMAYAYRRVRWPAEGLAVVAEALKLVDETGAPVFGAVLYHLKGNMLLMQDSGNESDAEQCFRTAIEIGRGQSAKSLELRAAINLARLLAKQGRCDEARAMLAEIYGWFTQGFDTADLKDAKALLDELAT